MGREASITIEQVFAIADGIKAGGGRPTSRAVREQLGTGSMGTINTFLQQWKSREQREQPTTLVLPPALQRAILEFMDTELTAALAVLETQLSEQQQETSDLATENQKQSRQLANAEEALSDSLREKAELQGQASQLSSDLDQARHDVARERDIAEHLRTELAKAELRLEALPRMEQTIASLQKELSQERQARISAEQHRAVLEAQKSDLEARIVEARSERERLIESLTKSENKNDQLVREITNTKLNR
jgi:chromosome segregation ATPase